MFQLVLKAFGVKGHHVHVCACVCMRATCTSLTVCVFLPCHSQRADAVPREPPNWKWSPGLSCSRKCCLGNMPTSGVVPTPQLLKAAVPPVACQQATLPHPPLPHPVFPSPQIILAIQHPTVTSQAKSMWCINTVAFFQQLNHTNYQHILLIWVTDLLLEHGLD